MKVYGIYDEDICLNCIHFEHDCDCNELTNDEMCYETCDHNDEFIRDGFYEEEVIVKCSGFKEG